MGPLSKLESFLDEVLNKKAPIKIPPNGRKAIANAMWWIALIVGVLDAWAAITFWRWGHEVNRFVDVVNYYTGGTYGHSLGFFYYASLVCMGAVGVLLLIAVPALKGLKKAGWNMVFYASLIELALAIVRIFSDIGGGFGNFLGSAAGAVVGAYFLFQVREYFAAGKAPARTATPPAATPEAK